MQLDAPVDAEPVEEPAAQVVQPVLVAPVLYVPAVHAVQVCAPVDAEPVEEPAPQLAQATVEDALYVPAAQGSHVVAPVAASVLVMDPGLQAVQLSAVHPPVQPAPVDDVARYLPAAH